MNEIVSDEFFDSKRDIYTDPFIFYRENSNINGNEAFVHQTNTTEMTIISSNITEEVDTFQKISLCIDNQNSSDLLSTNNLSDKLSILLHILTFTSFLQVTSLLILILNTFVKNFIAFKLYSTINGFVSVIIGILFLKEKTWKYAYYMPHYIIALVVLLIYLITSLFIYKYFQIQIIL
ncbi:hypothetical protein CWI37_0558p0010 [Hamiltosporidium tvaerminnensis]|uniref:Uncharacterized protein n=1 Tax=Hamiltosporidium tvaerminnensis TaxID=1176355 RepID=A0A4V2JUZ8_9MICR|nr:hypothetical protein CWI37_0558p0010 [Hamiltosporidium tvaerminnensis]